MNYLGLKILQSKVDNCIKNDSFNFISKKGSIFIEAAIFLPLIIFLILNLSYLIKIIYFQEEVFNHVLNEGRRISQEAYIYEIAKTPNKLVNELIKLGPQNKLIYYQRIKSKLNLNLQSNIIGFNVNEFKFMYRYNQIDSLIKINVNYKIENKLSKLLIDNQKVKQGLLIRAWTGKSSSGNPFQFREMAKNVNAKLVFVFPRAGEKYHSESCSYITSYPFEKILSNQITSTYKVCKLCNSSAGIKGELVYIFKYGKDYHLGNCYLVNKYIISMDISEAIKQSYLVCSKCNGGI